MTRSRAVVDVIAGTDHCAYCPTLCLHACPVSTAEANDAVSPWGKMSLARWIAQGHVAVTAENVSQLYKCTGCGACQSACRHSVDVAETLRQARANAVEGGLAVYDRAGFEVPVEGPNDRVLPVGASGCRLYAAGFTELFLSVARTAARRWSTHSEIVFAGAEDARCVRDVYPTYGITVRAKVQLAAEAVAAAPVRIADWDGPVAYHESCHIARSPSAEAAAIRQAAEKKAGGRLIELRWHGDTTTCCGASGGYAETSPNGANAAALRVLQNAIDKGAQIVLTGCGGCAAHLKKVAAELPIKIEVLR